MSTPSTKSTLALSPRDRFLNCVRFKPVDRVPNHELGLWPQTVDRWIAEGAKPETFTGDYFVGDTGWGLDHREFVPIHFNIIPWHERKILEETDRYEIVQHHDGRVTRALKEGSIHGARMSMDTYLKFPVEKPEDFAEVRRRMDPAEPSRYPANWDDLVARWKVRDYPLCLGTNASFGLYWRCRDLMGTEGLSLAFYDYPDLIHEMMDFLADFFIAVSERALRDIPDIDYFNFGEDMAFKSGPLLSPSLFREFMLEPYKRIISHLRSHGVAIISVDTDGYAEPLLPLLIEAGVDMVWPCEIAAEMDPVVLRRKYGRALAFAGGIDKRELTKDKAAIRRELETRLLPLIEDGGYIPTIDHTAPPDISYENYCYYMELKKSMLQ